MPQVKTQQRTQKIIQKISEDLKKVREEEGMSRQRFAKLLGIPLSTYSYIENGLTNNMYLDTLISLEKVLGRQYIKNLFAKDL